jgi:calcium uptake protein 1, mitochondrial
VLIQLSSIILFREIEREEFKKVMELMSDYNRQGKAQRNGLRNGLKVNRSVENSGLIQFFFGEDGNGKLKYDTFVEFLRGLHEEVQTNFNIQKSYHWK